jgi:hypothetical protein
VVGAPTIIPVSVMNKQGPMFIVQRVGVDITVLGFTDSVITARAMVLDCAEEHVRSQCGADRVKERYSAPIMEGVYLVDSGRLEVQLRSKRATVNKSGWFTSSAVTFDDVETGRICAAEFNPAKLHKHTPLIFPEQGSLPPDTPPRPSYARVAAMNQGTPLPTELMTELRLRLAPKNKRA